MLDMLDHFDGLPTNPLTGLKLVSPERNDQAALTIPPTAIGRPVRPSVAVPQPIDQTNTPTTKK